MAKGPVPLVWGFRRARLTARPEPKPGRLTPDPTSPRLASNTKPKPTTNQARRARPLPPAFVLMYHCDKVVHQHVLGTSMS